ncbi:MAG: FAD:protein FMN transferase [Bdellovibrionales bacterium]|nr:FAD:protein FMN transferase [Oligoflexia bacterium]
MIKKQIVKWPHPLALPLLLLVSSGCASKPISTETQTVERSYYLMGTSLELSAVSKNREQTLAAFDDAFQVVKDAEQRLSTWIPNSELSQVNAAAVGKEVKLSPLLMRDLTTVETFARKTDFAFNPYIGQLVQIWGLRTGGRIPTPLQLDQAVKASAPGAFSLTHSGVIKNRAGAQYEEGGFGKGIALDDALDALKVTGLKSAVLNFGGQIAVLGNASVPVVISNPSLRTETLVSFSESKSSIATSGNSEHGLTVKAKGKLTRIGHLIDSRTGQPSPFIGSITIVAPTATEAEVFTKIFVLGLEGGLRFANDHLIKALWIYPSLETGEWLVRTSQSWKTPLTLAPHCHNYPDHPSKKEKE